MRTLIVIIIFNLIFSCSGNRKKRIEIFEKTKIDSITHLNEIREFVKKTDSSLTDFLCVKPSFYNQELYSNSQAKKELDSMFSNFNFIKEDFDNNGYTDLIVTGDSYMYNFTVLGVMSFGNEKYSIIPLTLTDFEDFPIYPKLVYKNKIPAVELYSHSKKFKNSKKSISKKTVTYKYGKFIEYNEQSKEYNISKIEYKSTGCFGTCPVFELIINKNTKSIFKAKHFNFSKNKDTNNRNEEGVFEAILDKEKYEEICQIINYIQVKNLNNFYSISGTDHPSCTLNIHFIDGAVKTIEDYGKSGTNGLHYLYEKISDLRFNQEWGKIKTPQTTVN